MTAKQPPKGLKARGSSLWRSTTQRYSTNPAEAEILTELCRAVDTLDRLNTELATVDTVVVGSEGQPRAHPLFATIVEWRKSAELLSRRLALPDDMAAAKRSASAVAANEARWRGVS
jgi:hypothetical protein